ncbi:nitrite/sulfite reductase [Litorivicinus lipolyticus]|uniref:nitrite/sulfite reductase n=1 Tax=Litorivicinus lipolyticus TaxID=418701 RepID=UPI003B5B7F19
MAVYPYSHDDKALVQARVAQFAEQTERYLAGHIDEERFRPLRLQNGLYIQRHAPMLRVSIPYGTLDARQLVRLADIADREDRGYLHVTTRQNVQFNWIPVERIPGVLAQLAEVDMHAIQTSGACIRNLTSDPYAGTLPDEGLDPRVICEVVRQWATLHPEFAYLPRKFKIAVTGVEADRAAIEVHDIGLRVRGGVDDARVDVWVGGGLGRTPVIGKLLRRALPVAELLNYLDAILRVYNLHGRRDNKYKARIKILVEAMGLEAFNDAVEAEYGENADARLRVSNEQVARLSEQLKMPIQARAEGLLADDPAFQAWYQQNVSSHKVPGYRAVAVILKGHGQAPGDIRADQLRGLADLGVLHGHDEIRATHDQNFVFPYVPHDQLYDLYQGLVGLELAGANRGLATDLIACPGLDFCSLANAESLSVAADIQAKLAPIEADLGPLEIKISGCMNACAHHHIGHIGVLGVDKKGEQWYQLTLGGRDQAGAQIGKRLGPAIAKDAMGDTVLRIAETYRAGRRDGESFLNTVDRIGVTPFKEAVYADH